MSEPVVLPDAPLVSIDALSTVLNEPARWLILRELAKGEALPVKELARRVRRSPEVTSKHMGFLRRAGLVVTGFGRLYQLAPGVRPAPGSQQLDLGHCIIKLDTPV